MSFGFSLFGQQSFVVEKKYDIKKFDNTFKIDSTLSFQNSSMPLIYSYDKLSLFCKFEEKVARNSNVNMRFRLGSLDYVNYLEQKPNYKITAKN
ncbi:hypothetical protein GCM10007940_03270 [Portibacter lacus]|uniref:Uncharacterized protein n=1 Tax=Portibacter lacus TaxID=1099794 RepID=A0AA37SLT9_9BACT|nr:hypothetical protein GCM10007940_03270 [Portibacter lacus]